MGSGDRPRDLADVFRHFPLGLNGIDIDLGAISLWKTPFGKMHVLDLGSEEG